MTNVIIKSHFRIGNKFDMDFQTWQVVGVGEIENVNGTVTDYFIQAQNIRKDDSLGKLHLSFRERNPITTKKINRW